MYTHDVFKKDGKSSAAQKEFLKHIPARILQLEADHTKRNKSGVTKGEAVYKFEVNPISKYVTIEYFEHRDQGKPTMALYVSHTTPALKIIGAKLQKKFFMQFTYQNGTVTQELKFE